jgi:hypothetical protein
MSQVPPQDNTIGSMRVNARRNIDCTMQNKAAPKGRLEFGVDS